MNVSTRKTIMIVSVFMAKAIVMAVWAWCVIALSHWFLRIFMEVTPTAVTLSSIIIPMAMSAYYSGWFTDHVDKVEKRYAEEEARQSGNSNTRRDG